VASTDAIGRTNLYSHWKNPDFQVFKIGKRLLILFKMCLLPSTCVVYKQQLDFLFRTGPRIETHCSICCTQNRRCQAALEVRWEFSPPSHSPFREKRTTIEIFVLERVCLRWSSKHFWQKKPCKKSADLHPRQGNSLQTNISTGLNKTSPYNTK
jgi:hypothetical protein